MKPSYNALLQSVLLTRQFYCIRQFYWRIRHSFTDMSDSFTDTSGSFTDITIWKLNNAHLYFQSQEWGAGAMSSMKPTYAL